MNDKCTYFPRNALSTGGPPHDSSGERRGQTPIRSGKSYACHRSPGLRFVKIIPVGYRSAPDTHSFRQLRIPSCKLNRLFVQRRLPWRDSSAENPMINHIRRSQRGRNCAVLIAALRREWLRADIGRALYKIVQLKLNFRVSGRAGRLPSGGPQFAALRAESCDRSRASDRRNNRTVNRLPFADRSLSFFARLCREGLDFSGRLMPAGHLLFYATKSKQKSRRECDSRSVTSTRMKYRIRNRYLNL